MVYGLISIKMLKKTTTLPDSCFVLMPEVISEGLQILLL